MDSLELMIRNWRVTRGIPGGAHVWFDPNCEVVRLFRIPHPDGEGVPAASALVAVEDGFGYLDKVVSVSADGPGLAGDASERFEQTVIEELDDGLPF